MKKLNETIYNKLLLQAEEANDQGLTKLANALFESLAEDAVKENGDSSLKELKEEIYGDLWKIATKIAAYYGTESLDTMKLDTEINYTSDKLFSLIKNVLDIESTFGPNEPEVIGENK
jgi:hypothetical protein